MATDVSRDLVKLAKTWKKTEAKQGGGGGNLPDGEYTMSLLSMEVKHSKKGRLQVVTNFKIQEPKKLKGKEKMVFHGLENENNIAFFKGFAEVIGLELPDDMADLPDALQSFVDDNEDSIKAKFTTNAGGYQNMTILAVGDEELDSGDSSDEESDDEDSDEKETDDEDEDSDEDADEDEDGDEDEDEESDEDEVDEEDEEEEDKKKKKKKEKKEKKEKKDKKKKKKSRK